MRAASSSSPGTGCLGQCQHLLYFIFSNGEKHSGPQDELCVTVGSLAPEGLSAGGLGGGRAPAEGLGA